MKIKIKDLKIHDYAFLTPRYTDEQLKALEIDIATNGQVEPIKVCKGKIYDGRHRLKVMEILGKEEIECTVDDSLTDEDIRSKVMSLENRRHQTPTQLAIMAWKEYTLLNQDASTKVNQGEIAQKHGVGRNSVSEIGILNSHSPWLIDVLFSGQKFNIGSEAVPLMSNNVRAINKFFKNLHETRASKGKDRNLTDDEYESINSEIDKLSGEYGTRFMLELAKCIYSKYSEDNKNS